MEEMMQLQNDILNENRVHLQWTDGVQDEFPTIWLLHACSCEACGLSIKGVREQRLTDHPKRPKPVAVDVQNDTLQIDWGLGHHSSYQGSWLRGPPPVVIWAH